MGRENVPETLRLVESFANSVDVEDGLDDLETPAKAAAWLEAHGLGKRRIGAAELRRLRAFRDGLRALLLANHGEDVDVAAVEAMNAAAGRASLSLRFDAMGRPRLEAQASGLDAVFAEIQREIAAATAEGTWDRLKICKNDTCAVAFYDLSKNHSRAWCSMAVCGNRMKVRSYRQRHAES